MPFFVALLLIVVANAAVGFVLIRWFSPRVDRPAHTFAALALGTAWHGWVAFALAEFGRFNIFIIASLSLLLCAASLVLQRQRGAIPSTPTSKKTDLILVGWLVAAAILFLRPHEFVRGGADAGVYVNLGASIAETGSILIQDRALETLDPALYDNLLITTPPRESAPYALFPAFFVTGTDGRITPQFYHFHPVWQAIGHALGGVQTALALTGLWAILGSVAVFLVARTTGHRYLPWLVLTGLSANALQIWFARYPTTETLTQFLIWTGLWALVRWLNDGKSMLWPLLAGLMFGQALLTRIDTFFFIAAPVVLWLWWMAVRRDNAEHELNRSTLLTFTIPFGLLVAHAFAHAWWQSRPYFLNTFDTGLIWLTVDAWVLPTLVALGVVALGVTLLILTNPRLMAQLQKMQEPFLILVCVLIFAGAFYAWAIRPILPEFTYVEPLSGLTVAVLDNQNFLRLGWYLSPVGIWLAVCGCLLLVKNLNRRTLVWMAVGLFFTILYVWRLQARHHQIYGMRRFVPVTLPFLILCGATVLNWLLEDKRAIWTPWVGVLLTVFWLLGFFTELDGFAHTVNDVSSGQQIAALSQQFEPNALFIFDENNPFGQGALIGTTLRFQHQQNAFTLYNPDTLDSTKFEQQIERWFSEDFPLYWVETPNGFEFPLEDARLTDPTPYTIQFNALESTTDRKPSALFDVFWAGTVYQINP